MTVFWQCVATSSCARSSGTNSSRTNSTSSSASLAYLKKCFGRTNTPTLPCYTHLTPSTKIMLSTTPPDRYTSTCTPTRTRTRPTVSGGGAWEVGLKGKINEKWLYPSIYKVFVAINCESITWLRRRLSQHPCCRYRCTMRICDCGCWLFMIWLFLCHTSWCRLLFVVRGWIRCLSLCSIRSRCLRLERNGGISFFSGRRG